VKAATWECQRDFQGLPEASPGIRDVVLFSKFFGPLEFLARDEGDHIELLDFVSDPDYWKMIAEDPED
jgi:hypothetical protein